jgi:three-Cys-motif partner protein
VGSNAEGDPGLNIVPAEDGLVTPEVGQWSRRKYHFLGRYLRAFNTAMREKWPRRFYIDLFAGAGFARIKGTSEVVASSAVLAANVEHRFTEMRLCDRSVANGEALRERLGSARSATPFRVIAGDANDKIGELLAGIPTRGALSVTFADPFGLHLDFETVRQIAAVRSDLIILLADNMDALRNWATYYFNNPESSLDRFMGESGWRDLLAQTPSERQATALRTRYEARLQSLGYQEFSFERVQNETGRDIYTLLFASRHAAGKRIWDNVSKVDESGQRRLF